MNAAPDKKDPASLSFASKAIHTGNKTDEGTGAIIRPLIMANSYELPAEPENVDWSCTTIPLYTRVTGANQLGLQEKLAALEGGEDAVVLASGVAALHAVFFTFLNTGDHIVVADTTYEATWRLFAELLPQKYGIEATFVDTSNLDAVRAAMRPNTKLVHIETIANPTTRVADTAAIAQIAHEGGALLAVDSTFTPPPLYRPLADGADLVIHSLTKYINGHGDAMGGAVIGRRELIEPIKLDAMVDVGGTISPFNAWLITRGTVTLPLRLQRHWENAQAVAEFLAGDPRIAYVYYPGLEDHPQHELAKSQFEGRGFGGTLAFAVEGDHTKQNEFVDHLQLVTSAVSLGHPETLIVHVGTDGPRVAAYPQPFKDYGHLRLAAGLEDPAEIVADIKQALDATFGPLPEPVA